MAGRKLTRRPSVGRAKNIGISGAKDAWAAKAGAVIDWADVRVQRVPYEAKTTIFAQGEPATSVMYVEQGTVRLSVLSHSGKEAVIAILEAGHFFGEGCLVGQTHRMVTASAMS